MNYWEIWTVRDPGACRTCGETTSTRGQLRDGDGDPIGAPVMICGECAQ